MSRCGCRINRSIMHTWKGLDGIKIRVHCTANKPRKLAKFPMRKELFEENSIKSILADAMMNESQLTDPAIDWEITKHNYDLCAPPPRGFKIGSFSWLFTHHLHGIGFIIVMWEISPFLVQIFLVIHQRSRANMGTHEDKSPALLIGFGSSDNVAIYFNFPSQKTYLFSSFSPRRKDLSRGQ